MKLYILLCRYIAFFLADRERREEVLLAPNITIGLNKIALRQDRNRQDRQEIRRRRQLKVKSWSRGNYNFIVDYGILLSPAGLVYSLSLAIMMAVVCRCGFGHATMS